MYTLLIYFILLPWFFFLAILSLHFCRLHLICDKTERKITVVINRCMSRSIPIFFYQLENFVHFSFGANILFEIRASYLDTVQSKIKSLNENPIVTHNNY